MKIKFFYFIFFLTFIGIAFFSCNKNEIFSTEKLYFSTDTVFFDTVFTYVGSTTKRLKVYNKSKEPILIKKIFLAGGKSSNFRLNIDGYASLEVDDIYLDANDSLFIFVEVQINPSKDNLLVLDSIFFITDQYAQNVKLFAIGQDVHFFNGQILQTQTWTNDKPYLIYNSILIDSNQTLTIEKGVKIYSHYNSFIYSYGTIIINGTEDEPVIFQSDRLEQDYRNLPGQWGGIRLLPGSHDNYINHAIIKEAYIAIEIDTIANNNPNLILQNSYIQHCSFAGIYALATKTILANNVITDCGYYNLGLFLGGEHYILHNTIYNDYKWIIRQTSAVALNNYLVIDNQPVFWGNMSALFVNNIIYGSSDNEFYFSSVDVPNSMAISMINNLLKIDNETIDTNLTIFENCIFNKNPNFAFEQDSLEYYENRNYRLLQNSPAIDKGNADFVQNNATLLQYDITGYDRLSDGKPDLGAFEFH